MICSGKLIGESSFAAQKKDRPVSGTILLVAHLVSLGVRHKHRINHMDDTIRCTDVCRHDVRCRAVDE